ncbi:sugar ABC transporter ATP-binding protein [Paraburkholderia caffeinilytica]|uniref:sugar ABC transporter ATP-binding protein n=1 Tax=Paraburkholderia caffeinilytica TaxID=1761016 RepID=UPI0038BB718C
MAGTVNHIPGSIPPASSDVAEIVAELTNVSKRYGAHVLALSGVDFSIRSGEVHALLGKNGAGKSTLIRLLAGAELPSEGTVKLAGKLLTSQGAARAQEGAQRGVRVVHQELSLVPNMSVAENMFLGEWPLQSLGARPVAGLIDHRYMRQAATDALVQLGLDIQADELVSRLSPAQCQLVEIARAMMGQPRLVILDEPTSSLAAHEVELVFEAVRRVAAQGTAVIYVSHRMKEIRQIAQSATVIRDGRIVRSVALAGADTQDIIRHMLGHDEQQAAALNYKPDPRVVLSARNVAAAPKLSQVSLDLHHGEVLGIAGLLGSGRTELLKVLAGLTPSPAAEIMVNRRRVARPNFARMLALGVALTPENRKADGIFPLLGVDENTVLTDTASVSNRGVLSATRIRAATQSIIDQMRVKTSHTGTPIGTLSGGNQQKVVIGRWIHAGSQILLLDEPTRGVDVEAKEQIYAIVRRLAAQGKSVVFVSSEVEELPLVCDRVLILRDGTIAREFTAPHLDADELMAACIG